MKKRNKSYLISIGLVIMGCAAIGAIALYHWGHRADRLPGSWDDLAAGLYITYFCVPVFVVGLFFSLVGCIKRLKE